jgi:hypothetical protein
MELWSAPKTLMIHLKRFSYAQGSYFRLFMYFLKMTTLHILGRFRQKITNYVSFPLRDMKLKQYLAAQSPVLQKESDDIYDLIAVSNHFGSGEFLLLFFEA